MSFIYNLISNVKKNNPEIIKLRIVFVTKKNNLQENKESTIMFDSINELEKYLKGDKARDTIYLEVQLAQDEYPYIITNEKDEVIWRNKIVILTGMPLSIEMGTILDELSNDIEVDIERVYNTVEIQTAETRVNNSISTDSIPGREEMQIKIIEQMFEKKAANIDKDGQISYNKDIKRDARLDIVIGLPGSGKNSALVDRLSSEYSSRIIDNDEIKKLIPEYNNGWGNCSTQRKWQYRKNYI